MCVRGVDYLESKYRLEVSRISGNDFKDKEIASVYKITELDDGSHFLIQLRHNENLAVALRRAMGEY